MRYFWAVILLAVFIASPSNATPPSLDDLAASELETSGLPGVAYAIVDNGAVTSGAHGTAELRTDKTLTPDTPFLIGSISKSFTATAILQLVEAGDVELDRKLSQYLAGFQGTPAEAITIRQLLSHSSGYSTRQGNDPHAREAGGENALSRQVERLATWSPVYAPGTRWDYSNANYTLLGGVIEAVSGSPYDRYIEANILAPIGMKNSFVADSGDLETVATGHTPWFGGKRPVQTFTPSRASAPAGGIIASANDLALYLGVLLNGEDDVISAENKALMMRPASDQSPYYGLGWALDPQGEVVYHAGTSPGTETLAILKPSEGKGVVVLVNAGSGMGFGETANLINAISAAAFEQPYRPVGGTWGRKSLFLMFAALPLVFGIGAIQAWLGRAGLRAKSGAFGAFSLWFPLLMTAALAWVTISLIPGLFGVSISTLGVFSPDLAIVLFATAVTGVLWAVFRLGVYYSQAAKR